MSRSYWGQIRKVGRWLKAIWKPRQQNGVNESHPNRKQWEGGTQENDKKIIRALQRIGNQEEARYYQEKAQSESTGRWERRRFWLDCAAVVAVFLAAIYAREQVISMLGQQAIMQGQLDEMRVEQRPWVSIQDIKQPEDSIFDPQNILLMGISATLKNVGHSPANKSQLLGIITRDLGLNISKVSTYEFWRQTTGFSGPFQACDAQAGSSQYTNEMLGSTIFPNESVPTDGFGKMYGNPLRSIAKTRTKHVRLLLVLCARYQSQTDRKIHHTIMLFQILGLQNPPDVTLNSYPGTQDKVVLYPWEEWQYAD